MFFSKKPKESPWKIPDADQKKLFNDVRYNYSFVSIYNLFYF